MDKITQGEWKTGMSYPFGYYGEDKSVMVHDKLIARVMHTGDEVETKANAKLIAAAPDLLQVAKQTLFIFDNEEVYPKGTIGYELAQSAKAALQKATN